MLPYFFLLKRKNKHGYLYITFKHYNTKPKKKKKILLHVQNACDEYSR